MEIKQKKLHSLLDMGYDVTFLRNLRIGDTFQTREDGAWYVLKNISSYDMFTKKYCYHRIDKFSSSCRYYYAFGDLIVFNRNCY